MTWRILSKPSEFLWTCFIKNLNEAYIKKAFLTVWVISHLLSRPHTFKTYIRKVSLSREKSEKCFSPKFECYPQHNKIPNFLHIIFVFTILNHNRYGLLDINSQCMGERVNREFYLTTHWLGRLNNIFDFLR